MNLDLLEMGVDEYVFISSSGITSPINLLFTENGDNDWLSSLDSNSLLTLLLVSIC